MSSRVLLNLLNDLEKKRQNANLAEQISLFRNELNKFNNKRARMLDYTRGFWKVLSIVFISVTGLQTISCLVPL